MTSTEHTQKTTGNGKHPGEIERLQLFEVEDGRRPLAEAFYLRETTERDDTNVDGRYAIDVFEGIEAELEAILLSRPRSVAVAMTLAKVREAKHWATQWAIDEKSVIILDRRKLKVKK